MPFSRPGPMPICCDTAFRHNISSVKFFSETSVNLAMNHPASAPAIRPIEAPTACAARDARPISSVIGLICRVYSCIWRVTRSSAWTLSPPDSRFNSSLSFATPADASSVSVTTSRSSSTSGIAGLLFYLQCFCLVLRLLCMLHLRRLLDLDLFDRRAFLFAAGLRFRDVDFDLAVCSYFCRGVGIERTAIKLILAFLERLAPTLITPDVPSTRHSARLKEGLAAEALREHHLIITLSLFGKRLRCVVGCIIADVAAGYSSIQTVFESGASVPMVEQAPVQHALGIIATFTYPFRLRRE